MHDIKQGHSYNYLHFITENRLLLQYLNNFVMDLLVIHNNILMIIVVLLTMTKLL